MRELLEKTLFERIPGYATIRRLTHRMAGDESERVWKPTFAEIEEALVPAFIIEEFEDGRYTVFVPSVPTPFAGAVSMILPMACTICFQRACSSTNCFLPAGVRL